MLALAWKRSSLQAALAAAVLDQRRRGSTVAALLVLFAFVGIAVGLSAFQDLTAVPFDLSQVVGGVLLLSASLATFTLTWVGFTMLPTPAEAKIVLDSPEPYLASVGVLDRKFDR